MTKSVVTAVRTTLGAGAILAAAAVGALLPTTALASDVARDLPVAQTESRIVGATMLGGWIGGGILLLGTGVMVASTTVRRQRLEAASA